MIIPAINCADFSSASKHIRLAERFLPPASGWIQVDVSDGKFSDTKNWGSPKEYATLETRLNLEVHLMVEDVYKWASDWLDAGAQRLVVPIKNGPVDTKVLKLAKKHKADVMPSIDIKDSLEDQVPYLKDFEYVQLLAVNPGPSGQEFNEEVIDRIEFLRGQSRGVKIEIDGGVDISSGERSIEAGADILVSGSYIFNSGNPEEAYQKLNSLI